MMIPVELDQSIRDKRRERRQSRGRVAAGIRYPRRGTNGVRPNVGETIGPAVDETMVSSDVDDSGFRPDLRQCRFRFARR